MGRSDLLIVPESICVPLAVLRAWSNASVFSPLSLVLRKFYRPRVICHSLQNTRLRAQDDQKDNAKVHA